METTSRMRSSTTDTSSQPRAGAQHRPAAHLGQTTPDVILDVQLHSAVYDAIGKGHGFTPYLSFRMAATTATPTWGCR
jgi:hypothetical protein